MLNNSSCGLDSLNDAVLVALYRNNNEGAFTVLFGRYLSVIRSRAYEYNGCGIDTEDLVQEGIIGLLNAAYGYDNSYGAPFSAFARMCIDRKIVSAVRGVFRKKQIPKSSLVCIDSGFADVGYSLTVSNDDTDPERVFMANENLKLLHNRISQMLTAFEQQVLELYLSGFSYKAIAKELGCDKKKVDNGIQRIRKKLR